MLRNILYLIAVLFLLPSSALFAQKEESNVYCMFHTADSVILVSHLVTHLPLVKDITFEKIAFRQLIVDNRVNNKIVKESYKLTTTDERHLLAKILITPNQDSIFQDIKCFIPHHAILLYKNLKCSYFDICFGCRHFITSKNIKISDQLSDSTWIELESFFRERNLNYELPLLNNEVEADD